ncbi:MAG: response regulator transcription factor [Candidatus Dormibacteraeota bacterium]|nr:response regulator transcription factor [Candidatus Dormibacteraeota bacterium]
MSSPIRVIIAEDHTLVREGTREILEREQDIQVVGEAARGDDAVRQALEHIPDVLLMDMRMPGMNGIEATREVAAQAPSVKVLILSAHEDEDYVREALAVGASGYLLKTAPGRELVEGIRAVASGSTILSPELTRKLAQSRLEPARASDRLSSREFAVLRLIAQGRANKEVALELGISLRTVEGHLHNIFEKLRVGSRTEAVVHAVNHGLLSISGPEGE